MRVGDFLYYGLGTEADREAAADEYRSAADANNAQAMFNLGLMHHLGDGLKPDVHLAKRFYDMALRTSSDASVPASMTLYLLYASFAKEWFATTLAPAARSSLKLAFLERFDLETSMRVSAVKIGPVKTELEREREKRKGKERKERRRERQESRHGQRGTPTEDDKTTYRPAR